MHSIQLLGQTAAVFPNIRKCCSDGEYSHTSFINFIYIYIEVKGVLDTIDTLQVIVRDFVCNFLLHFKVCLIFPVSIYENLNVLLLALIYDQ